MWVRLGTLSEPRDPEMLRVSAMPQAGVQCRGGDVAQGRGRRDTALFDPGTAFQRDSGPRAERTPPTQQPRLQRVRCSRYRQPWTPRSALGRHHLTADFAGLMILRVYIHVPLAGGKLLRLFGVSVASPLTGAWTGLPLGLSQITGGPSRPPPPGRGNGPWWRAPTAHDS